MNKFFKVYLKEKDKGWKRKDIKTSSEVKEILRKAQEDGYERYLIVKRIEQQTDIPIAHGFFSKECKVVEVDNLDVDWRVVGTNVVLWDKYKERKEREEER